jgi:hypothetical protein
MVDLEVQQLKNSKNMFIDFKQLARVEEKYQDHGISINTLEEMIKNVLNYNGDYLSNGIPINVMLSIDTLKSLKILVDTEVSSKEVQQLNS